jgi:hypothetical protein
MGCFGGQRSIPGSAGKTFSFPRDRTLPIRSGSDAGGFAGAQGPASETHFPSRKSWVSEPNRNLRRPHNGMYPPKVGLEAFFCMGGGTGSAGVQPPVDFSI